LGAAGFACGLLLQGWGMANSVAHLMPNASVVFQGEVLIVAIIIFVIAQLARLPMSLSMSLVGLLSGYALASGLTSEVPYMTQVVAMWFIAPVAAVAIAYFLMRYINSRKVTDIWRRIRTYKVILIVLAFTSAYGLGANTLGLIVATGGFSWVNLAAAVAAVFVGSIFLGEGAIRRVSEEFYRMRYSNATVALAASTVLVETAAFLNIPLSNTQTTTAAVFGAGISYKTKFLSLKPYLTIVAGWVVAPLVSFTVGYLLVSVP
jgi:PiT family inorganic phosphate transporter